MIDLNNERMKLRSTERNPEIRDLFANPALMLAFGFGTGLSRIMPGTFGTLVGVPIVYLLCGQSWWLWLLAIVVAFAVGVIACERACQWLDVHDHRGVVWDEVVGYMVTMAFLPCDWRLFVVGFFLFRFFDIVKPWPISWIDRRVHGGFGVMLDDVIAGLFGLVVLQVVWFALLSS